MRSRARIGIDGATFRRLARRYYRWYRLPLVATDPEGKMVWSTGRLRRDADSPANLQVRATAIAEALRWGEPTPQAAPGNAIVWAVPLMHNARLTGGLVATMPEQRLFDAGRESPPFNTHAACAELRRLVEQENLTNAALLESRRHEYLREQKRAEGIHSFKQLPRAGLREMYLLDEPALVAAIRRNDRPQARAILNRILTAIIHQAGDRLDVVKSFFMELVVTLTRIAVEAGGAPQELLGTNYTSMTDLARIDTEEELAPWLHTMLERIMDGIQKHPDPAGAVALNQAIHFMQEHFARDISRADVARAAHLSPSHFSRLFKARTGQTFVQALTQLRLQRAAELLVRTSASLAEIALDTGFRDQSYFTRIFRKSMHMTPRAYRLTHGSRPSPPPIA